MTHLQDIAKVAAGLRLVLRESVNKLRVGDIITSTAQSLKRLAGTAKDIAGLSGGRIQDSRSPEVQVQYESEETHGAWANEGQLESASRNGSYLHRMLDSLTTFGKHEHSSADSKRDSCSGGQENVHGDGSYLSQPSEMHLPTQNAAPRGTFREATYTSSGQSLSSRIGLPSVRSHPPQESRGNTGAPHADQSPEAAERITRDTGWNTTSPLAQPRDPGKAAGSRAMVGEAAGINSTGARHPVKKRKPRERQFPSTSLGRMMGFAGLGAGLAWGTVQESAKRLWEGQGSTLPSQSALSPFLTEANAERVALALCRMRGAALKVGQMLSIQDESLVPLPFLQALERVRQGADVMPKRQLMKVISAELGPDWRDRLQSFDDEPMAAASIGQVHRAVTKEGKEVAMKVQYPGVANSIDSDIENVKVLLDYTNLIPEGLYLDQAMRVAKDELARECDYELEAANQKRFRELLGNEKGLYVPLVFDKFCSKRVLTTELVPGVSIDRVAQLDQKVRNRVGAQLLNLTLTELFVFRFMQTDPNWSNFLYDEAADTINLIDFGAAREYPKHFVDSYLKMVLACANRDQAQVIEASCRLGFLTGRESNIMLDTHVEAGFLVGLPFSKPGGFDFRSTNLPGQVSNLGVTMLRHRLTPPPDEAYSLHRKLSGAFLACKKLGAVVKCREMLMEMHDNYKFSSDDADETYSRQMASTSR